jgi:lactate permease
VWIQRYDPLGTWLASTMVAALPVLVLLVLLGSGRASAWKAALAGLLTASLVALGVFGMPLSMVAASAGVGVVFAVFRIIWLIVAAVFLYDITVETGQFEVMKASVAGGAGLDAVWPADCGCARVGHPGGAALGHAGGQGVAR